MQSEFDNLQVNDNHEYDIDSCANKQVIKIYCNGLLIAKKITQNKSVRYFGAKGYKAFLTS
jgi:hypothetical protein